MEGSPICWRADDPAFMMPQGGRKAPMLDRAVEVGKAQPFQRASARSSEPVLLRQSRDKQSFTRGVAYPKSRPPADPSQGLTPFC